MPDDLGSALGALASLPVVPVAIGGGSSLVGTGVIRLATPLGSSLHRHAPLVAAGVGAALSFAAARSWAGVATSLFVGGGIWLAERLLEYQVGRLLPAGR